MKNKFKFMLLTILIMSILSVSISAKVEQSDDQLKIITKNAVNLLSSTLEVQIDEVIIDSSLQLYDFNDQLIGNCIDFSSSDKTVRGYVIISESELDSVILEFSFDDASVYSQLESSKKNKLYYGDVQTKCYENKNDIINVVNENKLTDEEIKYHKEKSRKENTKDKSKSFRDVLLINDKEKVETAASQLLDAEIMYSRSYPSATIISGVPDYQWDKGCVPTAAAMILKYHFPTSLPSSSNVISGLATYMGTKSNGATPVANVVPGIEDYVSSEGLYINATEDGINSASTFSEYTSQINSYHPVLVSLNNSTATSSSYPGGFNDHTMAGVGYYSYIDDYIIVHTCGQDGNVYVNFDASSFGSHWWTYIN